MLNYKKLLFSLQLTFCGILLAGQYANAQHKNTTAKDNDNSKMAWWKDAKFGMFIHWGVYSVPAGIYNGKQYPGIGEWIMNHAKIPVSTYKAYAKDFNPTAYDPIGWVKMAKAAGMKYIVITSKHHEGFSLFDSKVTDWDVVNSSPYGKDLLKPLVEACRKEGIKIGFYYSQAQDWVHPGGAASGGHWDKAQDGDFDAYLDKIAIPQVKEILTNYGGLDILWFDTPQNMTKARVAKFQEILKDYPKLIINNRLGDGEPGDTETPEQFVPATGFPGLNWESCMTMNDTWGYKSTDTNWKTPKVLIRQLIDVVSKGGNMLLNVGPTSTGIIPQASVDRLAAIGKWLNVNKESIYGTRASPFTYLSYGKATRKGQKIYINLFDYPKNGQLKIPMENKITKAYFLAKPSQKIGIKNVSGETILGLSKQNEDPISTVIVIEFFGEPKVKPYPTVNAKVTVSSQKLADRGGNILIDGLRQTQWEAAKGERKATLEMALAKPTLISTLVIDEPWHPWENKKQDLLLEYKAGENWIKIYEGKSNGAGHQTTFKPVLTQYFRLSLKNPVTEPTLSEWHFYGPE